nr:response regulator transcription factor [Terrabacter sp. Root181]
MTGERAVAGELCSALAGLTRFDELDLVAKPARVVREDGTVTSAADRIRVLIVDDHGLYRRGLQTVLAVEDDIEVVAQAADGVEAVHQAEEFLPDVIVMDVGMPKRGGIEACRIIKQRVPSVLILMLTGSDDDADLFEAIRAGADGYLLKSVIEDIGAGIRGVANGESQLSPAMATKLLLEFKQISTAPPAQPSSPEPEMRPSLTPREVDVLQRVAQGRLNREIAVDLGISEFTVCSHIRNILDKLQMHSRMEAAMYAVRQRLIEPGAD